MASGPNAARTKRLDALTVGITTKKVNWVLDADLRSFFDTLYAVLRPLGKHAWLVQFIEHRVADKRIVRLIQKWLNAGVLEDGKRMQSEVGTVQGGSISPLLANIYPCTMCSTYGSNDGDRSKLAVMSSWCVLLMILPLGSSIESRPSGSLPSCASGSRALGWNCTPRRRG